MSLSLSICIPTYNRALMLEYLLNDLHKQISKINGIDIEVVIHDNASTDETADIVKSKMDSINIKYYRRDNHVDVWTNVFGVMTAGSSDYIIYCADDDTVIIKNIISNLIIMQENKNVGVIFVPWELRDGISDKRSQFFYTYPQAVLFKKGRYNEIFHYLVDNGVFPEIGIFRRAAVHIFPPQTYTSYWNFNLVEAMIGRFDVIMDGEKNYYYTSFTRHPADERPRTQVGNEYTMKNWDEYRGGLETLLSAARTFQFIEDVDIGIGKAKIEKFVIKRQLIGLRLLISNGRYTDAYYLLKRLSLYNPVLLKGDIANNIAMAGAMEQWFKNEFGDRGVRKAYIGSDVPENLILFLRKHSSWLLEGPYIEDHPIIYWNHGDNIGASLFLENFLYRN